MMNNFFKQAEMAGKLMTETDRRIRDQHKDCPNFVVVHDEYSCGPDCRVRNEMVTDAAKAEAVIPIDELEAFATSFNARRRT